MRKAFMYLVVMCFVLTSCTMVKTFFSDNETLLRLSTKAATARMLTEKPQWKSSVASISGALITAIDTGRVATLADVQKLAMEKIPMNKLTLEEKALAGEFVNTITLLIASELQKQGVENPLKHTVEVRKVFSWINEVAVIK